MRADAALSPCMLAIDSMDGIIKRRMFIRRQTSSFAILLRMHTRGRRFHVSRLAVVVVVLLLLLLLLLVALPPHGTDGGHAEGCDLVRRDRRVAARDLQPGHRQQSAGRQGRRGKLPCLRLLSLLVVLVRVAAHADPPVEDAVLARRPAFPERRGRPRRPRGGPPRGPASPPAAAQQRCSRRPAAARIECRGILFVIDTYSDGSYLL